MRDVSARQELIRVVFLERRGWVREPEPEGLREMEKGSDYFFGSLCRVLG